MVWVLVCDQNDYELYRLLGLMQPLTPTGLQYN